MNTRNQCGNENRLHKRDGAKKKHNSQIRSENTEDGNLRSPFNNKMQKCRAVRKLKRNLPTSPTKRAATIAAFQKNANSPTVKLLQNCKIIPSPEEKESATLQLSVLCDIKESVSKLKLKRCDKAREAMDFLTASFSGENVKKSRAKSSLAKKTWSSDP